MGKIIEVAKKYVGTHEATGHNDGPMIRKFQSSTGAYGLPWCASFVCFCFDEAKVKLPFDKTASVLFLAERAKTHKVFHAAGANFKPQSDDIGLILNPDPNNNHTFLVESVTSDGLYINTIEGNMGDQVKRLKRKAFGPDPVYRKQQVKGYIRIVH
jgi:hypothetical protein